MGIGTCAYQSPLSANQPRSPSRCGRQVQMAHQASAPGYYQESICQSAESPTGKSEPPTLPSAHPPMALLLLFSFLTTRIIPYHHHRLSYLSHGIDPLDLVEADPCLVERHPDSRINCHIHIRP